MSAILKPVQMEVYDPDNVLAPPDEIVEKMGIYKIAFEKEILFCFSVFSALLEDWPKNEEKLVPILQNTGSI